MTLGRGYTVIAGARGSWADRQLNGDLSMERTNGRSTMRATLFRRLAVASDFGSPLSFGAGLASLLYAGDEGFYYRAWGGELTGMMPRFGRTEWRLFAEQQWNAPMNTRFTLFRGAQDDRVLPNIVADEAIQYGASVRMQKGWGLDPRRFRANADFRAEGRQATSSMAGDCSTSPCRTACRLEPRWRSPRRPAARQARRRRSAPSSWVGCRPSAATGRER